MTRPDFLIVGGGIVGLTAALEARRRHPGAAVVVVEKEERCGMHASGRNSGVLHAGFYYSGDSLKARFSVEGNRRMTEYCVERGLPILRCGKLVVARNESELTGLAELFQRAERNGVEVERVSAEEARKIEPLARTYETALFSPTTSSVDPGAVVDAIAQDARSAGIDLRTGTRYLGREAGGVRTSAGVVEAGYVINAAGLYADRVARDYGFGERYTIIPFKGHYLHTRPGTVPLSVNIYPVPDLAKPFLGVHFTVTVDGGVKIGPTATPAFWREHYGGFQNFRPGEMVRILAEEARLFMSNAFHFRDHAMDEVRKMSKAHLAGLAADLVWEMGPGALEGWGTPGIRAQLLDVRTRELVMDFRVEGDDRSIHVLNAVSPAFTCAFTFADHLFDRIEEFAG